VNVGGGPRAGGVKINAGGEDDDDDDADEECETEGETVAVAVAVVVVMTVVMDASFVLDGVCTWVEDSVVVLNVPVCAETEVRRQDRDVQKVAPSNIIEDGWNKD